MLKFAVTNVTNGQQKASFLPRPVSPLALENLSAVKEASADLLGQLGVTLTTTDLEKLKRVPKLAISVILAIGGVGGQLQSS